MVILGLCMPTDLRSKGTTGASEGRYGVTHLCEMLGTGLFVHLRTTSDWMVVLQLCKVKSRPPVTKWSIV